MTDQTVTEPTQHCSKSGKVICFFMTCVVLGLVAAVGYGYYELCRMNTALHQATTTLNNNVTSVASLTQSMDKVEASYAKAQDLSAQQEKLVTEWQNAQKGDLDKWRLAEAQYLVKMASDHLQFTHDTAITMALLQRADETLSTVQNASVLEIRKAITANMTALQAAPAVDVTSLYLHINALDSQLEQLPLPVDPLQSTLNKPAVMEIPADTPWWKVGLLRTWQTLRQFVIIRNMGTQTMPLVLPEEKTFLYQNLHATLQSTMWAVLNRQQDVYQASLTNVLNWAQKYFVQDAPETKTIIQNIEELQKIDIKPVSVNLDETLQLFQTTNSTADSTTQPQASE